MQIQFKMAAFGAALLLAANACVTVSCDKDENENSKHRAVKLKTEALAGTYVVNQRISIKMVGQAVLGVVKEHKMKVVPATNSTVDITMDAYGIDLAEGVPYYSSAAQKSYTLKGVKVEKTGEKDFVLSGKVKADAEFQLVPKGQKKEGMPYRTFPATEYNVAGTVKDGVLELEYTMQLGSMPFPLIYVFNGKRA